MTLHAARLDRSDRLQRVLALLRDGCEHSTLNIVREARVCAVNSIASELRANGHTVTCRQDTDPRTGARIWLYRLELPS